MRQDHDDQLCVLLIEDDDADAYLAKRELLSLPRVAKIVRARNGREAIDLLKSEQFTPDLAFVDLQMPTMDGMEFLAECLAAGLANVPMVVLTSSSARQDAVRSRVRGAVEVITKPQSVAELARVLREAVDRFAPAAPDRAAEPAWSLASAGVAQPAYAPATAGAAPVFGRREAGLRR